ncbi:MAG: chromate transporter [Chitinophagaceae bacterium]|nr:chromate transporter [Rubrivivax sp.]
MTTPADAGLVHGLVWGTLGLGGADWWLLFLHFLLLSLLAVGGAITTAPDMQRFVVGEQGWLSNAQFSASVALAQAAPGPNVLFVAVIGWNIGGLAGVVATLFGTLLPSSVLTLAATRWGERRRGSRALRAFNAGMAPMTLGLLVATSWVLLEPTATPWASAVAVLATMVFMLRTRASPLWAVAAGALAGALGWLG